MISDDDPEMRAWELARDMADAGSRDQNITHAKFFAEMAQSIRHSKPGDDANTELIKAYSRGGRRGAVEKLAEMMMRGQSTAIRYVREDNE